MKEQIVLTARERSMTGKGGARKTRAAGGCPAVLYGPLIDSRALQIDPKALQKLLTDSGESNLIDLEIAGEDGKTQEAIKVIIRDLQYHPLKDQPAHVDFYQVALDRRLTLSVSLVLTGTCYDVEKKAGTLSQHLYEVNVECLPTSIPQSIELDISEMSVGQSLHVSDIATIEGVRIVDAPELSIVAVTALLEEVEEEEVESELETEEPEVIGEEKTETE